MNKLILVVTVLALCSLGFTEALSATSANQEEEKAALAKKSAILVQSDASGGTRDCSFTFTSGANNTFLQYCVTVNGNILQLQTPEGHFQIHPGSSYGEGYGICDVTGGGINYSDYTFSGTTENWNPPVLINVTGTSVKIARSTNDGIWTLTQTITQVPSNSSIKVVMALKNNSGVARNAFILRYADVDADGQVLNNLDGTHNSAMAWTSTSGNRGYGLMLQNVGNPPFVYDGFAQIGSSGPPPCNYALGFQPGPLFDEGSLVLVYVGTVPAKATRTFNMMYKGL